MDSTDDFIRQLNKNFARFHFDWIRGNSLDWWMSLVARTKSRGILFEPFERFYEVEGEDDVFVKTNVTLCNLKSLQDFYIKQKQYESGAAIRDAVIKLIGATTRSDLFIESGQGVFRKHYGNKIGYFYTSCPLVNAVLDSSLDGINPQRKKPQEQNLN